MKVKVTVNISQDVYEKAHSLGINVSKACENYLRMLNQTVEGANGGNQAVFGEAFSEKGSLVRSPGFEPGSSAWEASEKVDWPKFQAYAMEGRIPKVSRDIIRYANVYADCLLKKDLSRIQALPLTQRPNVLKSLSCLAKFLGCYEEYRSMIKNHGLKWTGKSGDDIFIDRLNNVEEPEEVWTWIKQAKDVREDLSEFLDLMAYSGLRLVEATNSYNLIINLCDDDKLDSYFAKDKLTLEHYRFKELFIRRSKKAYVSFMPAATVEAISGNNCVASADAVQKLIQKKGLRLRFADIREAHGTFMNKYLTREEIDFLHGRVNSSVFMQHYFNPSRITDLQARVFQGIKEIQEKIKV